jgi:CHASE2 domain-containing sensor protein
MNIFASISYQIRRTLALLFDRLAHKWRGAFYLYLAAFFSVLIIADTAYLHVFANMKQGAFDLMVRYRVHVPPADPDIVIVDINEASLAAMAKDYGRWPWPRQVLGEFVEGIEAQHPKAIVFDILFSDADVYNADSDAYFNAVIAKTDNTFFPMLRLNSGDDGLSQLTPRMIPGVVELDSAQADATLAMVLPFFPAALQSGRLGTHNIYADSDGIARQYPVYLDDYGWKIPSLPLRIAQILHYSEPAAANVLLNWRGPPFTYHSVGFSEVYGDFSREKKQRKANEFTNKIVIIGSTAPSLFDIKATPLSRNHPGVEILATAIDNFKHGDFLRFPDAKIIYLLLTLSLIWATAWGFYHDAGRAKIDRLFGASQFILLGISYASINFSNTYINLTGPVTLGLAYFTLARVYDFATRKALQDNTVRAAQLHDGALQGVLMLVRLGGNDAVLNDALREKIRLEISALGGQSVEVIKGTQKGLWDLFDNMLAISWLCDAQDEVAQARIAGEISLIEQGLYGILRKHCKITESEILSFVHRGEIAGGAAARNSWRALFGTALAAWQAKKGEA